ncbi:MAG: thiol-activated cytolysin family protein [Ferruginibacter sp.]
MKKISLLSAVLLSAVALHAQIQKMPSARGQMINRPINMTKFMPLVSPLRKQTFAGTFNPAPIVRNVGGVNISSTANINGTNSDNLTTNPKPGSAQKTTEGTLECTSSRETVTADSKSFMSVSANGDGIYPGALYTFSDFLNGNFLKEVGVGKRNPIKVFTNNLANSSGDVVVDVANPSSDNITSAIKNLVRNNSATNVSATQIGQYIYSQNKASLILNVSAGGAYSGFSASAAFNMNKQTNHIYITCDFKIPLYSLYTNFPENGFLNDINLEKTPNLVIINSVTYGTRVLVNIDIDESSLTTDLAAKFKYGDPSTAGFNADLKLLMDNQNIKTTVNTYVVGASPSNLGNPTTVDQVYSFVDACIRNTNYQTAKPIGYTISTMAGDLVGIKSATDEYMVKNCVPKDGLAFFSDVAIKITTRGNFKEGGSNAALFLYAGGNKLAGYSPNNNGQMGPNGDNTIGIKSNGNFFKSDFKGKNYLDILLDKPNCVITCDDWEISKVEMTINFKDDQGKIIQEKTMTATLCSSPFVIQKGKRLRLEFDENLNPLSQYITQ